MVSRTTLVGNQGRKPHHRGTLPRWNLGVTELQFSLDLHQLLIGVRKPRLQANRQLWRVKSVLRPAPGGTLRLQLLPVPDLIARVGSGAITTCNACLDLLAC